MNILFISIAWPSVGGRNLYSDLMDEFVSNGHNVFVAATDNKIKEDTVSNENGINVLRIRSGQIRKTSHVRKGLSLLSINRRIFKATKIFLQDNSIDLIIGHTPPITLSVLFRKLKHFYNAPFYLLLKDIWPQGSVDLKVLRKYNLPWLWLRAHEKHIYRTADYIGCMSPMGVDYMIRKNAFLPESKLEVCPNCIRPSDVVPETGTDEIRAKYNIPSDACVFIFSGNLGIGHGLNFFAEAIRNLADYKKAFFIIGGAGTHLKFLSDKIEEYSCRNVLIYEWLPREDFTGILAASDVGLVLLYRYTVPQFPSRLLSYLDYSKPVLCAVNDNTDIGRIVVEKECGLSTSHGNIEDFISAVKYLSENEAERKKMGVNARKLLMDKYTVAEGYKIIMKHFQ